MTDITARFGEAYHPTKALLIYQSKSTEDNIYVEAYGIDKRGAPIDAHPLTLKESRLLAKVLSVCAEVKQNYLKPAGLIPENLLYLNSEMDGFAVWYTKPQVCNLLFSEQLGIPSGKASVPALLWKASKTHLYVYALDGDEKPTLERVLYHAPFFNIYEDGKVCMGTVNVSIGRDCGLEDFIKTWQDYFFNSYFSHLIRSQSPVACNIVSLWKSLVGKRKKFPIAKLIPIRKTIKDLLL